MNRQGRILVVDDLEKWREQLVETLQRDGYYADAASTATEVLQKLDEMFYHLLVLDIRLIDVDPSNKEGMDLLGELVQLGVNNSMVYAIKAFPW
jgi:DNA-binding NtrC family response regulator